MPRTLKTLIALLLALACVPCASAQSLTGAVNGSVKDEQGGALPGVTVTLTGKTGSRTTVTDTSGSYRFPALDIGSYTVRAELGGFRPSGETVSVSIGTQLDIDLVLKVGALTETIEVLGAAPVVDTSSTATDNSLSQDLLYNMPIDRRSFNILNYAPGINDDSAFGGASDSANGLLLDGVDTRDPYGGTPWTFFNYNIIEEVKVQGLGAPAEYGSFTGAVVNTVTKSGGNKYAGLFDVNYTNDGLASNNVTPEARAQNPFGVGDPALTTNYFDVTGQLSGPIKQDKLFFFLSVQRFSKTEDPNGPNTRRKELSHRLNAKLTWQPSASDNLFLTLQADDYSINGRQNAVATAANTLPSMTVAEDAPELVWNAQWRHLFGSNTFIEAKYLGWWGYFYLDPENPAPLRYDFATGAYSGGAGYTSYSDRGRHQLNAAVSHFANAFGRHDLKFGVEVERSRVRERFNYTTYLNDNYALYNYSTYQYDYVTAQYQYGYDQQGRNHRTSAYAQDSWKPTERLTINAGVRFDQAKGISPELGQTVFSTNSWSPRIGFALDVTGDHSTVIKAHYGRFYEGAFFSFYNAALPGVSDFVIVDTRDGSEIDRSPTPIHAVDPNIKQPRVDELTVGFERALGHDVRLQVTGILRDNKNFIGSVLPSARWRPAGNAVSSLGTSVPAYNWANRSASEEDYLVTNPDGFQFLDQNGASLGTAEASRKYKALMFVLSKRFTNRWQAQASYVLSKADGSVDADDAESFGGGRFAYQFLFPTNALTNAAGEGRASRRHEIKLYTTYQIPKIDVSVNAYFRSISGRHWTPLQRFSNGAGGGFNWSPSSRRAARLEPRGSRVLDTENNLDLRLEKIFTLNGNDRLSVYADIINVFNSGTITGVTERARQIGTFDVEIGGATSLAAPRQLTLGARWSF